VPRGSEDVRAHDTPSANACSTSLVHPPVRWAIDTLASANSWACSAPSQRTTSQGFEARAPQRWCAFAGERGPDHRASRGPIDPPPERTVWRIPGLTFPSSSASRSVAAQTVCRVQSSRAPSSTVGIRTITSGGHLGSYGAEFDSSCGRAAFEMWSGGVPHACVWGHSWLVGNGRAYQYHSTKVNVQLCPERVLGSSRAEEHRRIRSGLQRNRCGSRGRHRCARKSFGAGRCRTDRSVIFEHSNQNSRTTDGTTPNVGLV